MSQEGPEPEDVKTKPTKALVALLVGTAGGVIQAAADGVISPVEIIVAVAFGVLSAGAVYGVTNKPVEE